MRIIYEVYIWTHTQRHSLMTLQKSITNILQPFEPHALTTIREERNIPDHWLIFFPIYLLVWDSCQVVWLPLIHSHRGSRSWLDTFASSPCRTLFKALRARHRVERKTNAEDLRHVVFFEYDFYGQYESTKSGHNVSTFFGSRNSEGHYSPERWYECECFTKLWCKGNIRWITFETDLE